MRVRGAVERLEWRFGPRHCRDCKGPGHPVAVLERDGYRLPPDPRGCPRCGAYRLVRIPASANFSNNYRKGSTGSGGGER